MPGAVALLLAVALREHAGADRMGAGAIGAGKAMAGGERDLAPPGAGAGALAVADARDRARRFLRGQRALLQRCRIGLDAVRRPAQQPVFGREAGEPVHRRLPSHRDRALRQNAQRFGRKVRRGDAGRSLADEHAQPDLLAFRLVDILQRAQPHMHVGRPVAMVQRVGGIGAGGTGKGNQVGKAGLRVGEGKHHRRT